MANDRDGMRVANDAPSAPAGRQALVTADPGQEPVLTLGPTLMGIGVVYALLTVISSALALAGGDTTETHVHLLLRFGVTTIGVGAFYAYGVLRRRFAGIPSAVAGFITYVLALAAVMAGVWLYGRVDVLHPDAYRDIFLNFTAVATVLSGTWSAATHLVRRRRPRLAGTVPSGS